MTTHKGSCHCGQVAIEVEGGIDGGMTCNCSICGRRGSVLWFVPRDKMTLKTPEADAASYTFNHHVIRHRFCPKCGIHVWGDTQMLDWQEPGEPLMSTGRVAAVYERKGHHYFDTEQLVQTLSGRPVAFCKRSVIYKAREVAEQK